MYYVYMLTNWNNKILYICVTNNIERRIYEHKNKLIEGFTSKYNLDKLVYVECANRIEDAIKRENINRVFSIIFLVIFACVVISLLIDSIFFY